MSRLPDWEQRLGEFMAANRDREFAYGQWDCILFACAAAEALTGRDEAADFRGRYKTAKGARAILRERGAGTLLRTVDRHFRRKGVGYAQRGDLIWFGGAVGVCLGATAAFLSEPRLLAKVNAPRLGSMVLLPRRLWQKAWSV